MEMLLGVNNNGSHDSLPGKARGVAVSVGLEAINVKTRGFGKVKTGPSANIGLESLIAELYNAVGEESAGIDVDA